MSETEDVAQQQKLLATYRRTLALYLEQLAQQGKAFATPGLLSNIIEAQDNIRYLKMRLRNQGIEVEDFHIDEAITQELPKQPSNTTHNESGRAKRLWIVGIGFVLLLLGVFVIGNNFLRGNNILQQSTQTVPPTQLVGMLTQTQSSTTPSLSPTSPTNISNLSPEEQLLTEAHKWPILFVDNFEDERNGWSKPSERSTQYTNTLEISDGYIWNVGATSEQSLLIQIPNRAVNERDLYLSVECTRIKGNGSPWGIVLRAGANGEHTFRIMDTDQTYFFYTLRQNSDQGRYDPMGQIWPKSNLIRTGSKNRISVVAQGHRLIFFINDMYVDQFVIEDEIDRGLSTGKMGLFVAVGPGDKDAIYKFEHFEARIPVDK